MDENKYFNNITTNLFFYFPVCLKMSCILFIIIGMFIIMNFLK